MGNREGLKTVRIGQSAAKPRKEEGSTTIPKGSRGKRPEVMRSAKWRMKIWSALPRNRKSFMEARISAPR